MAISETIRPHGGVLIDRALRGSAREEAIARARNAPRVTLSDVGLADLELIASGVFSPLTGFLGRTDYERVVGEARLADGSLWPIPISLPLTTTEANELHDGDPVALYSPNGQLVGLLELRERYEIDPRREAAEVYRTTDEAHPGVARLYGQGTARIAGEIWLIDAPKPQFPALHLTPVESRRSFSERGWRTVVGFQTRNPVHRAHEYIQKVALELVDGLFLHPLVGATKDDDLPADVRVRSYEVLLKGYYPAARTMLAVFPAAMRYAGPREALLHAIARQNYGCTHFMKSSAGNPAACGGEERRQGRSTAFLVPTI